MNRELSNHRFEAECTAAYVATIRGFVTDNIARKLAEMRSSRGMYEALEREEEWDEQTDLSLGASCMYFFEDVIGSAYNLRHSGR